MKLTHIACENAGKKAQESGKPLKLADGHGLYLQAVLSGARYWRFKYRFAGKEKLLALGVYPEVSLKEARDKREQARKLLADNQDPSQVKKEKRLNAFSESENTFEKLAREWFEQQRAILTPKHADALVARFERDVFISSTKNTNLKKYSESYAATGRLDAEYYQPKYEAYENAVKAYKKGQTTIAEEFDPIKEASLRDKKVYNYIEIGDLNVSDGSASFTSRLIEELPDNAKLEAKRGDLLISKVRPNRGAVSIINFDDTDLIVSGAFTVLRQKKNSHFSNEMLKVLLRTPIYRDWMLKFNVGTQYPVIRDEDILNLPIPKLDAKIQQDISAKVQEAQTLKKQSEILLEIAKRGVEMAIEQDEKSAEQWMRRECKSFGVDLASRVV